MEVKTCTRCGVDKPADEFSTHRADVFDTLCRNCYGMYAKRYRETVEDLIKQKITYYNQAFMRVQKPTPYDPTFQVEDLYLPAICPVMALEGEEVVIDYTTTSKGKLSAVAFVLDDRKLGFVKGNVFVVSQAGLIQVRQDKKKYR